VGAVSFVSAVLSLADYGWRVVRRLNEFRNNVKELPQCFLHISFQLPLLMETVERLHRQAHDDKLAPKIEAALAPVVDGLRKEIEKLDAVLLKVLPLAQASTWEKIIKAVKSVGVQKTVDDFATVIRDYVSTLTAYQATQHSDELKVLVDLLKDHKAQTSTLQNPAAKKPVWMIGYDSDEHFIGRDGTMNDIERQFNEKKRVAITGIGGVG
jgi:hypothetical protein